MKENITQNGGKFAFYRISNSEKMTRKHTQPQRFGKPVTEEVKQTYFWKYEERKDRFTWENPCVGVLLFGLDDGAG